MVRIRESIALSKSLRVRDGLVESAIHRATMCVEFCLNKRTELREKYGLAQPECFSFLCNATWSLMISMGATIALALLLRVIFFKNHSRMVYIDTRRAGGFCMLGNKGQINP